jgi:hypothetical protein
MKKLFFVTFFFLIIKLFGNDYFYYLLSGGTLMPASDNETLVELVDEVVIFDLYDDFFVITADYNFYNHGEAIHLLVGFPYAADAKFTLNRWGSLFDFQSLVNDSLVETRNMPIEIDFSDQKLLGIDYAYTKEVFFPSQQNTKTRVTYKAKYGADKGMWLASYLYGSGKGWFSCIGKAEIIIKNNSKYWIYGIKMGEPSHNNLPLNNVDLKHHWVNNDLVFLMKNFEPGYNDVIEVFLYLPLYDINLVRPLYLSLNAYIYRRTVFKPNQLWYLTKEQLRLLRNLFYALYGYNFKDAALLDYFSSYFGSYEVNLDFNENMLSAIERQNVEIIQIEELKRQ